MLNLCFRLFVGLTYFRSNDNFLLSTLNGKFITMESGAPPGVNFINILWAFFTRTDPESAKRQSSCQSFWCFWDLGTITARRTLMKLIPADVAPALAVPGAPSSAPEILYTGTNYKGKFKCVLLFKGLWNFRKLFRFFVFCQT